jgi:hypothetical protein
MGLKAQLANFHKSGLNLKAWQTHWLSTKTGGILILTSAFFFITVIGAISTHTTYTINQQILKDARQELEIVKNLFFLDEQYQSAVDNKTSSNLSAQYSKFNQPTSFSAMKIYLKKWQSALRIKTLSVTIEPAKPYTQGQGIMIAPITLKAQVLNDKMLYQLLEKLQQDAPGLIVLRHVDLKRLAGSSPQTIDQLLSGKSNALVEGTIVCDWFFMGVSE